MPFVRGRGASQEGTGQRCYVRRRRSEKRQAPGSRTSKPPLGCALTSIASHTSSRNSVNCIKPGMMEAISEFSSLHEDVKIAAQEETNARMNTTICQEVNNAEQHRHHRTHQHKGRNTTICATKIRLK